MSTLEGNKVRRRLKSIPGVRFILRRYLDKPPRFGLSSEYWTERYLRGGNSGFGSYGRLAAFKADFLNEFVVANEVATVLELGCGDGNQLSLAHYPDYVGVDISETAIAKCRSRFENDTKKRFIVAGSELPICELGLSLDVIYHLVEDERFEHYMAELLRHSSRFVVLYTSNSSVFVPDRIEPPHIRHRDLSAWMARQTGWELVERIPNRFPFDTAAKDITSFADFYVYRRL
jgi:SAM-dependent methyltransferase